MEALLRRRRRRPPTLNVLEEYLFADNELTELAKKIERVMTHARNPYVRVNSDNDLVAANESFFEMVGYRNINIDKLREGGPLPLAAHPGKPE